MYVIIIITYIFVKNTDKQKSLRFDISELVVKYIKVHLSTRQMIYTQFVIW